MRDPADRGADDELEAVAHGAAQRSAVRGAEIRQTYDAPERATPEQEALAERLFRDYGDSL